MQLQDGADTSTVLVQAEGLDITRRDKVPRRLTKGCLFVATARIAFRQNVRFGSKADI